MLKTIKAHPVASLLALLFVLTEIAMGIYVQIGSIQVNVVAYCSVVLAFAFVACCFAKNQLWAFTACAMANTLLADVFLVLTDPRKQLLAMVFFNCAQIFYALRLFYQQTSNKARVRHLTIRVVACTTLAAATLLVLRQNANTLAVISAIYYANLLCNIVYAFTVRDYTFAVGLVFFALCDAFVGLGVLCQMLDLPTTSALHQIAFPSKFDPVWAFYVPSQTLIALSTLEHKLKTK